MNEQISAIPVSFPIEAHELRTSFQLSNNINFLLLPAHCHQHDSPIRMSLGLQSRNIKTLQGRRRGGRCAINYLKPEKIGH